MECIVTIWLFLTIHLIVNMVAGYDLYVRCEIKNYRDERDANIIETKIYPTFLVILLTAVCILLNPIEYLFQDKMGKCILSENLLNIFMILRFPHCLNRNKNTIFAKSKSACWLKRNSIIILFLGVIISFFQLWWNELMLITIVFSQLGFLISCVHTACISINIKLYEALDEYWLVFSNFKDKYRINVKNILEVKIINSTCAIEYTRLGKRYKSIIKFQDVDELSKIIPLLEKYNVKYTYDGNAF